MHAMSGPPTQAEASPGGEGRGRHILHVYKDYPPVKGGIEGHIALLARAQAAAGHRVTVLVTDPTGRGSDKDEDGVRVIRARRLATVASTPLSLDLPLRLGRLRPDLCHLHSPYPVAELAWLLRGRHPMVLTWHSDVVRQRLLGALWAPGQRALLARADRVLATSPRYAATSPFLRRVPPERLRVVPLGIRPPAQAPDPARARARFGAGPNLVFVGQLRYYKGLGRLLEALALLRREEAAAGRGASRPQLLVAGRGPMEAAWRAQAAALGLADQVRWLGALDDGGRDLLLAAGDLYVLPAVARSEAFGLALLEAMAAGLPLLSTELGTGTSWVNQHEVTGLVVPPEDPASLAAALRRLLADEGQRQAMGRAAKARFDQHFTATAMLAAVEGSYREVLS